MSSKKEFIDQLKQKYAHYDLQTGISSKRPVDPTKPNSGTIYEATSKVTIFDFTQDSEGKKNAFTVRAVSGLAEGSTLKEAEDAAIVRALEHLGLGE